MKIYQKQKVLVKMETNSCVITYYNLYFNGFRQYYNIT